MKATVVVELKSGVLDPQGKAIEHSLNALGFGSVEDVRVAKLFRITLREENARNSQQIEQQIRQMCEKLLANTVIENFTYQIEP
ncbi:MAG: phosphoribosylformylglycinamidine synthase subunit PurS [Bryobacteraceae bacterium]|nr:phosphoribosylformylglycinamidine synthase subunit PurS [Bryobacteraceae bacterium]